MKNGFKKRGKLIVWLSLVLFAGLGSTASLARAIELASHEAIYDMAILSPNVGVPIRDVSGKINSTIRAECDGWISTEDYFMEFTDNKGENTFFASHFESWEQLSSDRYSFDILHSSTKNGEEQFGGYAILPPASKTAEAYFSSLPDMPIALPENVYFPVDYIRTLIDKAEQGETLFSADVFFGSEPEDVLKRVSTAIGNKRSITNKEILGTLALASYYPVHLAFFDPKSTGSLPEYEITYHLQENGVVAYYEVDYGDFAIQAVLANIKMINPPNC